MLNRSAQRVPNWLPPFSSNAYATLIALIAIASLIAILPVSWLLLLVAAIAGSLLALIFPWLAWIGFAFALPITSGIHIGPASATDLYFAAAFGLWIATTIRDHRRPHHPLTKQIPVWPIAIYLMVLYLSTLGASDLDEALTEMVKWIEFALLLLVVPRALPSTLVCWLVAALLTAAALQGLYGLYQFVFRIGPDWFLIQGRFMRASGVFSQPNPFGAYLGLSLPVALSLALWSVTQLVARRTLATLLWAAFYNAAALCITVGLVASWSRGAWLGATGAVIVVLALYNRRTALLLGLSLLALTITALLGTLNPNWIPAAISSRIIDIPAYLGFVDILSLEVNDDNFAVVERVAHWFAALRMWETSPWLGVGPGNYASAYATVALPRWSDALGHAHNIYLNVLGETGILGFSTFLLFWSTLVGWSLHQRRILMPMQSWSRALTIGVLGVLTHLAIHSFFDNLFVQGMYLHVALWLAAVAASVNDSRARQSSAHLSESDG